MLALSPRRRSERGELLRKLQAMSSALAPAPEQPDPRPVAGRVTYLLNPTLTMSSGKTLAQVAHAAVMAAARLDGWADAGCPARVVVPSPAAFHRRATAPDGLAARVEDAGLTEVAPGTVTVLALSPTDLAGWRP